MGTIEPGAKTNPPATASAKPDGGELTKPSTALAGRGKSIFLAVVGSALTYDPIPLTRPLVRADFKQASSAARILEALWYFFAVVEYRVGPNGWFRAWMVLWLRALLIIVVPLIALSVVVWLFVPVMMGVDSVSQSFASIAHSLEVACGSLFWAVLYILGIVASVAAFFTVLGMFMARRAAANQAASTGRGPKRVDSKVI